MSDNGSEKNKDGVPYHQEECRHFDGKRCRILGCRPCLICEPEVMEMAKALTAATQDAPEALPCPFCGAPGKKNNARLYPEGVGGHCSNRECPAFHINCSLEFWNTRAPNKEK